MKVIYNSVRNLVGVRYNLLFLFSALFLGVSCTDDISAPPIIKVFVNDIEMAEGTIIAITENAELAYRFEVQSFTTIANFKTVFFDISIPNRKKATEVLVGGLSNSHQEVVRGVIAPVMDTEIMLVVKDVDGNEVAKSFSMVFE